MKKLLGILVVSLLWCNVVNAATATCYAGECDIYRSVHYGWAQTNCFFPIVNEEIETMPTYFTIVDDLSLSKGETCFVFESR